MLSRSLPRHDVPRAAGNVGQASQPAGSFFYRCSRAQLLNISHFTGRFSLFAATASIARRAGRASSLRRCRQTGAYASESDEFQNLEALAAALQLAGRSGDKALADKLTQQLEDEEATTPFLALRWRQKKRLQVALDTVLLGVEDPLASRIEAVAALEQLASPPLAEATAEEALHTILREVSGKGAEALREAADSALWNCWLAQDDEEIAEEMKKALFLMEGERLQEALQSFTRIIEMAPGFAEAWNKRATVYFLLEKYDESIEDCHEVLALKPKHFGCLAGLGLCHNCKGDSAEATKWYKEALKVHPCMRGARANLDAIERQGILQTHLKPRLDRTMEALKDGSFRSEDMPDGLSVSWDVHNVQPRGSFSSDDLKLYFFRVCLRNKALGTRAVRSLGRFYTLRFDGGHVFPLMRPTEGPAEFILEPGEEYRYAWAFTVSRELVGMVGGMLLERMDSVGESDDKRFLPLPLDSLSCSDAPVVPMRRVEQLCEGHLYMGQLDLREVTEN